MTSGTIRKGDWFFMEALGAWTLVPKSAVGEMIHTARVARALIDKATATPES